ncbi:hypothetical protein AABB24_019912, partial [Solanum stoloniferum]
QLHKKIVFPLLDFNLFFFKSSQESIKYHKISTFYVCSFEILQLKFYRNPNGVSNFKNWCSNCVFAFFYPYGFFYPNPPPKSHPLFKYDVLVSHSALISLLLDTLSSRYARNLRKSMTIMAYCTSSYYVRDCFHDSK